MLCTIILRYKYPRSYSEYLSEADWTRFGSSQDRANSLSTRGPLGYLACCFHDAGVVRSGEIAVLSVDYNEDRIPSPGDRNNLDHPACSGRNNYWYSSPSIPNMAIQNQIPQIHLRMPLDIIEAYLFVRLVAFSELPFCLRPQAPTVIPVAVPGCPGVPNSPK